MPDLPENFIPAKATEEAPCPLCASTVYEKAAAGSDYEYYLPGEFFVCRCKNCGLLYQNPRPPFPEIMRYYTENYAPYNKSGSALMRWIRRMLITYPKVIEINKLIGKTGRILDVGCSTGVFLSELNKNGDWELEGVEPKKEAADIAAKEGLKVYTCTLEEAKLKPESYDLITMNHVLEHLPNPGEITEEVFKLLKRGGYFYGFIPSSDCLERRFFRQYWQGYHLPRHLTWFSRGHLKKFLKKYGFTGIKSIPQPHCSNWQISFRNYLYDRGTPAELFKTFSGNNVLIYFLTVPFTMALAAIGQGPIQKFIARKP